MFGSLMGAIYTGISWILMRWHDLWSMIVGQFLNTNWDWILAIVFLVITVRIVLFPIFVKQIRSQRAMQTLQPKMKELQEKHKGDKETLRQEMMKLYQTEKVNPLMGCLPMFLQIPVFLGLFHVLRYLNPLTEKDPDKLYGWTTPLFDSASHAKLFGAPISMALRSPAADILVVHGSVTAVHIVTPMLVVIMMVTTFLTSRQMILKTGWSQDPQQRMIQKLMLYGIPVSLLLSGWAFPVGVIIYWVTQNLFSLGQQYWVLHKYPPPVTAGNIPMKTARQRAEESPRNVFARFLAPKESDTPAASGGAKFRNPVQPAGKSGLFRRRTEPAAPAVPEVKSLGPKPGAKPVKVAPSAKTPPPVDTPPLVDTPPPAQSPSPNGTAAKASDPTPNGARPDAPRSGGGRSGAAKSTAAKKAAPRKGPANKKGGPRR
jgi:YidC/Oxa1 family membrane protein insertase